MKDELHRAVDELPDVRAPMALAYLRVLLEDAGPWDQGAAATRLARRMGPLSVSGRDFFASPSVDLPALLAEQNVTPAARFEDLLGDFWPEDESVDEFIAAVHRWRCEGGCA